MSRHGACAQCTTHWWRTGLGFKSAVWQPADTSLILPPPLHKYCELSAATLRGLRKIMVTLILTQLLLV